MFKSITTVLSGTVLAQGLALLFLPIISRTYDPAEFGAFQILASAIVLLLPFAALKMELAILRLRSSSELPNLLVLCLAINITGAILLYLGLMICVPYFAPDAVGAPWTTWMLPAGFLTAGILQTFGYVLVRNKRYAMMAASKAVQSGLFHAGAAISGWIIAAPTAIILMSWDIVGRVLASIVILANMLRCRHRQVWKISPWKMLRLLRAYRRYPFFLVPSSFIGAIVAFAPVFWLSFSHGAEAAGQFGMAWRSVFMPLTMIIYAVSQVVSADLSNKVRSTSAGGQKVILRVTRNTVMLGGVPVLLVFVLGEPVLTWVLGVQWAVAGQMVEAMAPLLLAALIAGPINMALVIVGQTGVQFKWELVRAIIIVSGLWGCTAIGLSSVATIAVFSSSMLLMAFVFLGLAVRLADKLRRDGVNSPGIIASRTQKKI